MSSRRNGKTSTLPFLMTIAAVSVPADSRGNKCCLRGSELRQRPQSILIAGLLFFLAIFLWRDQIP